MTGTPGSIFGARGPIIDPAHKVYDWVLVDQPGADWDPRLLRVYDYWRSIAPQSPERRLPARRDWDVLDVATLMPQTRFLELRPWDQPPGWRYLCRLVGTNQVEALGFDPTGRWMDEAEPWTWGDARFIERQEAMRRHRAPTWRRGQIVFERDHDQGILECLQMPFANDGETVDMVADVTFYSKNPA